MRVILFGASGMVGQGVLRECVLAPEIDAVLCVVRRASAPGMGLTSEKVRELVTEDISALDRYESELAGYDACFFCVGVSAVGMKEAEYRRITWGLTLTAARIVERMNPAGMTFVYVSGAGTNAHGRAMWARVKGETENAVLAMQAANPRWKACAMRPGFILPMHGIESKTKLYRVFYSALRPLLPLLRHASPRYVTTTEQMGQAMILVAQNGYRKPVLEAVDITDLAAAPARAR